MPLDPPPREDTYFIDPESGAELARLMHQGRLISKNMGGLLPEGIDLANMHDILDLACGPGEWVLDVAFEHPEFQVIGVDLSREMVAYARAQAHAQGLDNANFSTMNILKPLEFPDNSFDLVNGRLLVSFMPASAWSGLLQECMRVLRPGGIIRLTEADNFGITSSPAYEKLTGLAILSMQLAGQAFLHDEGKIGVLPRLGYFLRQAGCIHIQQKAHVVDYSVETEAHRAWYQNFMMSFNLLQPFMLKMGVTTQQEVSHLYQQALSEMWMNDFCAIWIYLSVWGEKPEQ